MCEFGLTHHYAKWLKGKAMQANRNINLFGDTNKKEYLEKVYKLS